MRILFLILVLQLFPGLAVAQENKNLTLRMEFEDRAAFRVEAKPADWSVIVEMETVLKQGELVRLEGTEAIEQVVFRDLENGWRQIEIKTRGAFDLRNAGYVDRSDLTIELISVAGPRPRVTEPIKPTSPRRPVIVIDAGHGGIDSGAVREDIRESDLMLEFARKFSDAVVRSGRFRVELTRDGDEFLRLSQRIDVARRAGAAAFISLHADALLEGNARGAAVFTLSEEATSAAASELVEFHERSELFVDQATGPVEDDIAAMLVEMTQRDTNPRSIALSNHLIAALAGQDAKLRKRARQSGDFGVLKAPDIPSVLIELGFMSDETDLKNLTDPGWRTDTISALVGGLLSWADAEETAILGRE